jgi:hypothetical protein
MTTTPAPSTARLAAATAGRVIAGLVVLIQLAGLVPVLNYPFAAVPHGLWLAAGLKLTIAAAACWVFIWCGRVAARARKTKPAL